MEKVLKINNFDKIDNDTQEYIKNLVSLYTNSWEINVCSHCDLCGYYKDNLIKKETDGGLIRVCSICNIKIDEICSNYLKNNG